MVLRLAQLYSPGQFSFRKIVFELLEVEAAQVLGRCEPGFLCRECTVADVFVAVDRVSVGIDGDEGTPVEGVADPAPINVQTAIKPPEGVLAGD